MLGSLPILIAFVFYVAAIIWMVAKSEYSAQTFGILAGASLYILSAVL